MKLDFRENKFLKIASLILLSGSVFYLVPKTILMIGWLDSGVTNGYFYLLAPVNLLLMLISGLSILAFKSKLKQDIKNSILSMNIFGLIGMGFWIWFIYGS